MIKLERKNIKEVRISIDEMGKVYFYNNRVLIVINEDYIHVVKEIFESGFLNKLIELELFPMTWIVDDIKISGYNFIVEHKTVKYWNYPYEWSFNMLKDAALVLLEVNNIANQFGFELIDTHFNNVVFDRTKPKFFDLGGFEVIKDKSIWKGYIGFYDHFYATLYLWSNGYVNSARNITLMNICFSQDEFFKIKHPIIYTKAVSKMFLNIRRLAMTSSYKIESKFNNIIIKKILFIIKKFIQSKFTGSALEDKVKKLNYYKGSSTWGDYHTNIDVEREKRFQRVLEIICTFKDANTLVEVASNQGKFASYVSSNSHLENIIATDYDEEAVDTMYLNNRNSTNLVPFIFDFIRPNGRILDKPIQDRIKSDIVMALALTHHLILSQNIDIDYILKSMRALTNKYIIIEFMPLGLYDSKLHITPKVPTYYTTQWFKDNFEKYFFLITDEQLEVNRHLFVGKTK